jgi:hypothetical protein
MAFETMTLAPFCGLSWTIDNGLGAGSGQLAEKNLLPTPFCVLCDSLLFPLVKGFPRAIFQSHFL